MIESETQLDESCFSPREITRRRRRGLVLCHLFFGRFFVNPVIVPSLPPDRLLQVQVQSDIPLLAAPPPPSASFPPFPSRSNPAGRGTHRKLGQCAAQLHFQLHVLSSNRFPPMQCLWRAYKICTGDKKWSDPFSSLNSFHGINSHHYLYIYSPIQQLLFDNM